MDLSLFATDIMLAMGLALLNGVLAMSEMAMVSAKKIKLQQSAQEGSKSAVLALKLLEDPSRFLAAIQIGITFIGMFSGAVAGANISKAFNIFFANIPLMAPYANTISMFIAVGFITLISLIFGELVPKRLALGHSSSIAITMARPISFIAFISKPAVNFLALCTEATLKILRYKTPEAHAVTDEEVRMLIEQGSETGVFDKEEETIIKRTLKLSDKSVTELMTSRTNLVCIDFNDQWENALDKMCTSGHSYFPVFQDSIDHIIGIISVKKVLKLLRLNQIVDIASIMEQPIFVGESLAALKLLSSFKETGKHFAVVIDEYGGLAGVVTVIDLLESIVGDISDEDEDEDDSVVRRADGSWLIDGIMPIVDVAEYIELDEKAFVDGPYETLGGFVMNNMGQIPRAGDRFTWKEWEFEVLDMDGNRVDKVLIVPPKNLDTPIQELGGI